MQRLCGLSRKTMLKHTGIALCLSGINPKHVRQQPSHIVVTVRKLSRKRCPMGSQSHRPALHLLRQPHLPQASHTADNGWQLCTQQACNVGNPSSRSAVRTMQRADCLQIILQGRRELAINGQLIISL
jgi:hypothetical protein